MPAKCCVASTRCWSSTDTGTDNFLQRRAINEVDDVADVLFVGHALESFFRESDEGTEVFRDLAIKFEPGARIEFGAAGDRFQSDASFRWRNRLS